MDYKRVLICIFVICSSCFSLSFGYGNTVGTFSMAAPYIDCIKQGQRSALRILSLEGVKVSEIYERIIVQYDDNCVIPWEVSDGCTDSEQGGLIPSLRMKTKKCG